MANDISEPEVQLDEFGEPIPTQQEMENERSKTDQVLKLVGASALLEGQLPARLPTQPLPMPVSQGRMYMGPALTAPEEAAFLRQPSGTSINLMPPPAPEESAGVAGRIAEATQPAPDPRLTSTDLGMRQFAAQEQIRRAMGGGMTAADAMRLYGQELFGGKYPGMMTEAQRANYGLQRERLDLAQKSAIARDTRLAKPKATAAVQDTYNALNRKQVAFEVGGDVAGARRAQVEKDAFIRQHPELGLSPELGVAVATRTTTAPPPAAAPPTRAQGTVTSKAQFDALPSGAVYIGKNGKRFRKP